MQFHRRLLAAVLGALALPASATTILFIGNSFTFGAPAGAPAPLVQSYKPDTVTDLNKSGIGGVPALFKAMTVQAGLHYDVSLETIPGAGLERHYNEKLGLIAGAYDQVVLQSYSTLDKNRPGNPALLIKYAGLLAQVFRERNPKVHVMLNSTWSRADQTWTPQGAWYGKPVEQMALDLRRGYDAADAASNLIDGVIPVGQAWNRAIATGVADPNPYDGIKAGQVDLWAPDHYHGSVHGYYLEALTLFGAITGRDPRSLGANDAIARDIGIAPATAAALQRCAAEQLEAEKKTRASAPPAA